jgi:ATP-binding cassette subfamily B protein
VLTTASVEFERVVFTFEPSRGPLLRGISILAEPGQKLAIVGSSGAGKSTLARLLFRLYNVDSGRILVGGVDIKQCTLRSVRLAIAIVPQDTVLFNDTLHYNISLGKLARGETLASEEEVMRAVDAAQLTAFLRKQPKGLQTVVGERGLRLSGGEKQRVAIARALLKDAPVMVGDEATSALDSHTETEIMRAMDSAATGRTYIVIAHRLSTIVDAQKIAVLHEGLVAELGTHAELLDRNGLYAAMWAKHAAHENEESSR